MRVLAISPRGYCYGVVNAIKTATRARQEYPDENIYVLGMIVHNKYIMKALELKKIITLDDSKKSKKELLKEIDKGIIILSAHGSTQEIKDIAKEKGLIVYDATCKDVTKTHDLIKDYLRDGYDIIYYGKDNHPEAVAATNINTERIHLITNKDDINKLQITNDKILLTNQTTISVLDAKKIIDAAKEKFPNLVVAQEICNATRVRQQAIIDLDNNIDIVFVVGDPASNNSNKLASIAKEKHNVDVYMIESSDDIQIEWLQNKKYAGITSGASTPTYLTNLVIEYLKQFDSNNEATYTKPIIDYNKILD